VVVRIPWFKVDDGFWAHPKVLELSSDAGWLWTRAGAYAAQQLTDGRITQATLAMLGSAVDSAGELVSAGLWDVTRNGWQFHDWELYQPTREDVLAERAKTAERVRKYRESRKNPGAGNAVTNAVGTDAPTRPDPTRPNTTPKGVVGAKRATRIPDQFMVNQAMRDWAAKTTPGVNVDNSTAKFVDHWRAKSGKDAAKLDWVATWRNWLRSDYDRVPEGQRKVVKPPALGGPCVHRFVGGWCAECSEREP